MRRTYVIRVVDIPWVRTWSSIYRRPWMLNMIPSIDENEKVYGNHTNIIFEEFKSLPSRLIPSKCLPVR